METCHLIKILKEFKFKHNVEIILEPGSAIAWETGDLYSEVLDIHESRGIKTVLINGLSNFGSKREVLINIFIRTQI